MTDMQPYSAYFVFHIKGRIRFTLTIKVLHAENRKAVDDSYFTILSAKHFFK